MATVQDLKNAKQTAKNAVETQQHRLRVAIDEALGTTIGTGNYIDSGKLEDERARKMFTERLNDVLVAPYSAAIAAMPEDPQIARALTMSGAYGFKSADITSFVDKFRDKFTYEGFMQAIEQNTGWENALKSRGGIVGDILAQISAAEVGNYAGIAIKNADALTLQDKAELIELTDNKKSLDELLGKIKEKPYMRDPRAP